MPERAAFNRELLPFLQGSPTPFHAVERMSVILRAAGFNELAEGESWSLQAGGRYFLRRNGSSLVAFILGRRPPELGGWRMIGAHTDSPCLKVKPRGELVQQGYLQLGVEVYGGVLLNPWFDRDLSLAGRVSYRTAQGELGSALLDFRRPLAVVPSLAIHLDRDANNSRSINAQKDLPPLLMQLPEGSFDLRGLLLERLREEHPEIPAQAVLDHELSFYDCQPPALVGLQEEFITSARLDNLLSCFIGLRALMGADDQYSSLLVCNDHEEVGSQSMAGAQGPMLASVLARVGGGSVDAVARALDRSMLVSCDNAHALHPNFADRHDGRHGPRLNGGPVIKSNVNQRYATNSETAARFRALAEEAGVAVQDFVVRSDMACGSTIGPITASTVGVPAVDVGVPQLAMHSIRELCGAQDPHALYQVLCAFCAAADVRVSGP